MVFGIVLFCGGILFERYGDFSFGQTDEKPAEENIDPGYLKQWENLLNYDGNERGEEYEDK